MIVIVEGIDRVGKTTLCEKLGSFGFVIFKDAWHVSKALDVVEVAAYSLGKLDTSITLLELLDKQGVDVVVDRLHLTELVYGVCEERGVMAEAVFGIDRMLARMGVMLVCVGPSNIKRSSEEAGKDLYKHAQMFRMLTAMSAIKDKHVVIFDGIDDMVEKITMERMFRRDEANRRVEESNGNASVTESAKAV
jgi:hypothetical protein